MIIKFIRVTKKLGLKSCGLSLSTEHNSNLFKRWSHSFEVCNKEGCTTTEIFTLTFKQASLDWSCAKRYMEWKMANLH